MSTGYFASEFNKMGSGDAISPQGNESVSMPSAEIQTVGGLALGGLGKSLDSFASGSKTAFSQVTGRDHTNSASLKTNVTNVASGANAGTNIQANVTAQSVKADISEAKGNFVKDLTQTQAVLGEALKQGADNLGLDAKAASNSFAPTATRSEAGALAGVLSGPVVGAAIAIGDVKSSMDKKLNPQDEIRLAEQVMKLLTPVRDANGNVIGPAPIPNNLDQEALAQAQPKELVDLIKQVMMPAEMQPEMKAFNDMEAKLDHVISVHNDKQDVDGIAVASDVDTADVNAHEASDNVLDQMKSDLPIGAYGACSIFPAMCQVSANDEPCDLSIDKDAVLASTQNNSNEADNRFIIAPPKLVELGAGALV